MTKQSRSGMWTFSLGLLCVLAQSAGVVMATDGLYWIERHQAGHCGIDGLRGARSVAISPDGKHVYVAGWWDKAIAIFARNRVTGELTFVEAHRQGGPESGVGRVATVAVSQDGRNLYVVADQRSLELITFRRDTENGRLTFVNQYAIGPGSNSSEFQSSLVIPSDGRHVLVVHNRSSRFRAGLVSVFDRDPENGALRPVEDMRIPHANDVAVSPSGSSVYITAFEKDGYRPYTGDKRGVGTFVLEGSSAALETVEWIEPPEVPGWGAVGVAVSPDGASVFATTYLSDSLLVFDRDPVTGRLQRSALFTNLEGPVDGLFGPRAVVVSPTGTSVFAASPDDNAIAVFARDPRTGTVEFVEFVRDGIRSADGLTRPRALAVSPDGRHLYVASVGADTVAVFAIAPLPEPPATITPGGPMLTPTRTRTPRPTHTITRTRTRTQTRTGTNTRSPSPTRTLRPGESTFTPTLTHTITRTPTVTPTPTITLTPTISPTATVTPTCKRTALPIPSPTSTPEPVRCTGDCNADGQVTVTEIILGINDALSPALEIGVLRCPALDANRSDAIEIQELITAINNALSGCPATRR